MVRLADVGRDKPRTLSRTKNFTFGIHTDGALCVRFSQSADMATDDQHIAAMENQIGL